jgi:hypothetical protein
MTDKVQKAATLDTLTLNELRGILSDEINRLRNGDTSAASANAVSNATGKILSSIKLEMEYQKLTGRKAHIPMLSAGSDE